MNQKLLFEQTYTESELHKIASLFWQNVGTQSIVCFEGQMGAGKTTLISSIVHQAGFEGYVHSPTFGLIHHYTIERSANPLTIYHADLYRLQSLHEALDIGIEDLLTQANTQQGTHCFIEWYQILLPLLHTPYYKAVLTRDTEHSVSIQFYLYY
ncbi:MAG: tRNA (adenosine(37)-N6)-threonylcarbamoyltransferase complex ATPase subunit type 1 TsaE [Chitinophagia bacterium]|nr:tRNA (adenosine(37)-N6)-threonylcarbamoyltransferase complex ATPase subunit type 1 TsaE [Chitinophagia bacterium]